MEFSCSRSQDRNLRLKHKICIIILKRGDLKTMKYIKIGIFLATVYAIGGGDIAPFYEPYAQNCSTNCKNDSTYVDEKTQLMWQDTIYDDASDGAYKKDRSACKAGSLSYAKNYCESSNSGGYYGWRLPTSDEMMAISVKKNIFKDNRDADFWTSTPAGKNKHYVVYAVDGFRYERDPMQSNYIRCVRCVTKEDSASNK